MHTLAEHRKVTLSIRSAWYNKPMQQDPANPLGSNQSGQNQPDYNTPVAYDNQGRPLYARPPEQQQNAPQMVYLSRPLEAAKPEISPELQQRIDESHKQFPHLNLSEG